jgi:Sulfotransferase family
MVSSGHASETNDSAPASAQNAPVAVTHLLSLGPPRSGTTLLAAMISRHTEIGILNENKSWAMRQLLGKVVVGNKRCIPNQIELKKRGRLSLRFFKTIGLAKEYQSSEYSIEDYLTLPNIKILCLIRSGDDVISSIMKRGEKNFRIAAYRWRRAIEIIHYLNQTYPKLTLVVSFEDVVMQPREMMERIAKFLGVEYQERMLEGPKYNPWYTETRLDQTKVRRANRENVDFKLQERFPGAFEKYRTLVQIATLT